MDNEKNACCFFGHRKISETPELTSCLKNTVEKLITEKSVDTFLFGSKSEFDSLCLNTVTELKEKYPYIRRIYVRAAFADIDDSYKSYLLESYEDTYFPEKMRNAGKASYAERNCEMIDKCRFCIVYYDESYAPPKRRNSRRDISDYQPKSGTKIAFDYASKKKRKIINLFG